MEVDDISEFLNSLAEGVSPDETFEPVGSVKQMILIMEILEGDVFPILNIDYDELTAGQCRAVVRAVFALIEGLTYRLKQTALEIDDVLDRRLTAPERMAIKEQASRVDESGQVKVRTEYPAAAGNVRFAFNVLKKATCSEFELEVDVAGWDAFKKSIPVRDRITHPKQASDLEINVAEIATLKMANKWFHKTMALAMLFALKGIATIKLRKASESELAK